MDNLIFSYCFISSNQLDHLNVYIVEIMIMKIKILLLFIISALFNSCQKESSNFTIKNELVFNLNYKPLPKYTGIYNDKKTSKEYIYFADPISKKCIKIFDTNSLLIDSIILKKALDTLGEIDGISIISLDTILIGSLRTNKIVAINKQGNIWHYLNLNSLVNAIDSNVYVFHFSALSNFNSKNNYLTLNCEWRFNKYDKINEIEPKTHFEFGKYYSEKYYKAPYFLNISNYFDYSPKVELCLNGFYKNISNTADIFVEPCFYKSLNNKIYLFSVFSNKIFEINPVNFKIEQEIKVISKFTKFNQHPIKVKRETDNTFQDSLNYNGKTKASINRLFYDNLKKEFYVIIFHELNDKTVVKKKGYFRPFSVLIYNQDFTQSREYNFEDSINYEGYRALLTKEGLMIPIKNKDEESKFTFRLFKFNN